MDKKIIFFDIDGTLFDPVIGIPDSTREGIKLLGENGHIPVICTGRTKAIVPEYLMNIGFCGMVAGAGTYVEYLGEVIHQKVIETKYEDTILPLLKQHQISYLVEGPEYIYYDRDNKSKKYEQLINGMNLISEGKVKPIDNMQFKMNKISAMIPERSHFEAVRPMLEKKFHLIYHQESKFIEIVPKGYNKAIGIQKLIEHLNFDHRLTYAFGDSTNDIEMLEYVEYGIAMGNSYPEVLKMAKYKTKSITEDGIYYGLKKFGLI